MTDYERFLAVDKAVTDRLEELGSYSILIADGNTIYLEIAKSVGGVTEQFHNEVLEIERDYCETLGDRKENEIAISYVIGYTDIVYRARKTDSLLDLQTDENTFELINMYKYDIELDTIIDFLKDNPNFVMRVVDNKTLLVRV